MGPVQTSPDEHTQFDAICEEVGDWETLPTVTSKPIEPDREPSDEEPNAALDGLILAGLVSP